ncbi:MAG: hypothetical protein ACOYB1_18395 [Limnohabitans sp.]
MATSLGTRTLSDHLILQGLESAPAVAYSARRTLGGRMVTQRGPTLASGRELALQSENHLTYADVAALKAIYALGQPVTLTHPRLTATVLITGLDVQADTEFVNPSASGADPWYSGTINLLEV